MSGLFKKARRKGAAQAMGSQQYTGIVPGSIDPARRAGPDAGGGDDRRRMPRDIRPRRRQGNRRLGTEVRTPLAP